MQNVAVRATLTRMQRIESSLVTRKPHGRSWYFGGMTISRFTQVGVYQLKLGKREPPRHSIGWGEWDAEVSQTLLARNGGQGVGLVDGSAASVSILFKTDAKILECPRKRGQMQAGRSLNHPVISGRSPLAGLPRECPPKGLSSV